MQGDGPLLRRHEPGEDVHERRLPRPVFTEHRVNLARQEVDGDIVQSRQTAETLRNVFSDQHWLEMLAPIVADATLTRATG